MFKRIAEQENGNKRYKKKNKKNVYFDLTLIYIEPSSRRGIWNVEIKESSQVNENLRE